MAARVNFLIATNGDGFRIYNYDKINLLKLKSFNKKAHRPGVTFLQNINFNEIDIATGGNDGVIKLWNIEKGISIDSLKGHAPNCIYKISFCP